MGAVSRCLLAGTSGLNYTGATTDGAYRCLVERVSAQGHRTPSIASVNVKMGSLFFPVELHCHYQANIG